jgi:cyclopropane fatty-acyl-phospholipid synthase-like methyltransferase
MSIALQTLGRRLLTAEKGLRWPNEKLQAQYTGTSGERLLTQATDFIELIEQQVPLRGDWRGLDYGVGWGRLASLMTVHGSPQQLDGVDAWATSLQYARDHGLENVLALVSPMLKATELPGSGYDFAYAYSIFTHLPAANLVNNIGELVKALRPGGILLFTARDPSFRDFLQKNNKFITEIEDGDYWFGNAQSEHYGDTIVSHEWLQQAIGHLGKLERIGKMPHEGTQIVYSLTA